MSPSDGEHAPKGAPRSVIDAVRVREIREAQTILERYKYSFLAKKLGKIADAMEAKSDDDA